MPTVGVIPIPARNETHTSITPILTFPHQGGISLPLVGRAGEGGKQVSFRTKADMDSQQLAGKNDIHRVYGAYPVGEITDVVSWLSVGVV